jgi:hypothetical protein
MTSDVRNEPACERRVDSREFDQEYAHLPEAHRVNKPNAVLCFAAESKHAIAPTSIVNSWREE